MPRPSRIRTVDPRDEALRALIATFARDYPEARVDMLREAIDDAIEADPHNDPLAVALSMLGQIQYDAEVLAGYLKFALAQSGGLSGLGDGGRHSDMIEHSARQRVNEDLIAAGFDGNRRWPKIGAMINRLNYVLTQHGLELATVTSADLFREHGRDVILAIAWSNEDDPFSPTEIRNSHVHLQYYKHAGPHYAEDERVEAVAYLS
jgi:hypothetical protein